MGGEAAKIEVTYRTFLYVRYYPLRSVHVGVVQEGSKFTDGKPIVCYGLEFVRWLDEDWRTESVEVSDD